MDRILEIGQFAAGYCGRLFVEPAPGWVSNRASDLFLHAGKKRLQTSDPTLIRELADKADIVIAEAATADQLSQLGFDSWQTKVKVAITPFGRTGPKRNWHASSSVLLAMGGYTWLMGDQGRAPLTLPGHFVDYESGQFAYTAANACRISDEVNSIDLSMLEVVMSLSQFTTIKWHCQGEIRMRHGNDFWTVPPTTLFACKDGWVYINIVPIFWDPFTTFIDIPELVIDDRFTTNELRMENREALHEIIQAAMIRMTTEEIDQRAIEHRIPVGIVKSFQEVLDDPHFKARDFWQELGDGETTVQSPAVPFRFDNTPHRDLELNDVEKIDG